MNATVSEIYMDLMLLPQLHNDVTEAPSPFFTLPVKTCLWLCAREWACQRKGQHYQIRFLKFWVAYLISYCITILWAFYEVKTNNICGHQLRLSVSLRPSISNETVCPILMKFGTGLHLIHSVHCVCNHLYVPISVHKFIGRLICTFIQFICTCWYIG